MKLLLSVVGAKRVVLNSQRATMAVYIQTLNPLTGQQEWTSQDDNYDYHQEVANTGFGDMLHDQERNRKYFQALRKIIADMHAKQQQAHVLDIGTGTGILSMMAVAAGADSVTACEAFLPMANCAERIIAANNMAHKIRLIKKRSTELRVPADMCRRANLLVTEVLDTELIGEGALEIYNHAHEQLLTDDVICIPASANCYAQVMHTPLAAQWNSMKVLADQDGDILLEPPASIQQCKGSADLHDLQMSQLPLELLQPISKPAQIFTFDFSSKTSRPKCRSNNLPLQAIKAGSTDLVCFWWDIQFDQQADIVLSCAPFWAHPEYEQLAKSASHHTPCANIVPWRDHWMQAIYYIPKPLHLRSIGEKFVLSCNHDAFSFWFDAMCTTEEALQQTPVKRHNCSCNLHLSYSRNRIAQMNQTQRNKCYLRFLEDSITKHSIALVLGHGNLLGLAMAKMGAQQVYSVDTNTFSRHFLRSVIEQNQLQNVQLLDSIAALNVDTLAKLTHVFAEPYFLTSILPWDNFCFGNMLIELRKALSPLVQITPCAAKIWAVPVQFLDLHKIRTPVEQCEGFNLSIFDEMVNASIEVSQQSKVEAQPLWEYPCRALAEPTELLHVDFAKYDCDKNTQGLMKIQSDGTCTGIAIWVDWHIDDSNKPKSVVSTGPTAAVVPGEFIKWDMFVRQGVHLLAKTYNVKASSSSVHWTLKFQPKIAPISFDFKICV